MQSSGSEQKVDVVIPVYGAFEETRACLESVLASTPQVPHEVVVIDDCGPEPALGAYLQELAAAGKITLLRNVHNMGFVRSVNLGMALHPARDVVLLNSDTEVAGDWLDRLRTCAYREAEIGTVTPFSNNATICSYPRFCEDNALPAGWNPQALDGLFATVNRGAQVEIPTAVGFCVYIKRECIKQAGFFDATKFGRGYGEENDFCMRALDLGFKHVLCGDVFVYHKGGVSFAGEGRKWRAAAEQTMRAHHPHYDALVRMHIESDPIRPLRRRVDLARLIASPLRKLLFISHRMGGGTERHIRDLNALLAPECEVLILRPAGNGLLSLEWARPGEEFRAYFAVPSDYPRLLALLRKIGICRVHIHHVMELPLQVFDLPADLGLPYDITAHDHYLICPQFNLGDLSGQYCGEPDAAGCNACLAQRAAQWGLDIVAWRAHFSRLIEGAERVIVPSRYLQGRLQHYFPVARCVYLPHPEEPLPKRRVAPAPKDGFIKVLVLGTLNTAKGLPVLLGCAEHARAHALPLHFHVLGATETEVELPPGTPLSFHGPYRDEELQQLIARERANLVFFPTRCPETYSYTLTAALRSGLPIAAPRLGAFIERLEGVAGTTLMPWDSAPEEWNRFFLSFDKSKNAKVLEV